MTVTCTKLIVGLLRCISKVGAKIMIRPVAQIVLLISRVPDLGQGKNEWVQIWLDLERREFGETLALLSEEIKFWSFPDPARSELFRNLTITHYFDISRWFHAINTVIDALSWINIDVYLTQCMHSIYCIMKIEVHCTVSDKSIWSVSLIRQLYLRILSTLNLN